MFISKTQLSINMLSISKPYVIQHANVSRTLKKHITLIATYGNLRLGASFIKRGIAVASYKQRILYKRFSPI